MSILDKSLTLSRIKHTSESSPIDVYFKEKDKYDSFPSYTAAAVHMRTNNYEGYMGTFHQMNQLDYIIKAEQLEKGYK